VGCEARGATAFENSRALLGAFEFRDDDDGSSMDTSAERTAVTEAGVELDPVNLATTSSAFSKIHGVKVGSV
jgi:hypothetical protein